MDSTNKTISELKSILQTAYSANGKNPLICTAPYPVNQGGDTTLDLDAKKKAGNGIVYLCRMTRSYGEKKGGVYNEIYNPYALVIYHNSKTKGAEEIRDLLDISRDALHIHVTLLTDEEREIGGNDGLYMAWLLFKPLPHKTIYAGTTDK